MARRLAAEGYAVICQPVLPDRAPSAVDFSPELRGTAHEGPVPGTDLSPHSGCPRRRRRCLHPRLKEQPEVTPGMVGIVGYCFTGAMALRGPSKRPDAVAAAASFHGGRLYDPENPASPHRLLPQIKARLYFGHASNDHSMTAEQIAGFESALAQWGGHYESETYRCRPRLDRARQPRLQPRGRTCVPGAKATLFRDASRLGILHGSPAHRSNRPARLTPPAAAGQARHLPFATPRVEDRGRRVLHLGRRSLQMSSGIARNTSTMYGSNCDPAPRAISSRASLNGIAPPVRPVRSHRIQRVRDRKDPRAQRNLLPRSPRG